MKAMLCARRSMLSLAVAACAMAGAMMLGPVAQAHAVSITDTAHAVSGGKWKASGKNVYYVKSSGKKTTGFVRIGGKGYYFDKKGVQRTGWRKVGDNYCYFKIANKSKGSLVSGKVVNGVKIKKDGTAYVNKIAKEELDIMVLAQKRVDAVSKPLDSTSSKLKACFRWIWKDCVECSSVKWSNTKGLHRRYARDILVKKAGSCDSMGSAYAYLANACGAKSALIAASGGHTWAAVNGKVCDPEQAKQGRGWGSYMLSYRGSFYNGMDTYKVHISPRKTVWSKAKEISDGNLGVNGWVTKAGKRYYYVKGKMAKSKWVTIKGKKYYFTSKGTAAVGGVKAKGTYYVFDEKGVLLTGKATRNVTVKGVVYRVDKSGKAAPGWTQGNKNYYASNGALMTGLRFIGGKLLLFSDTGEFDAAKSAELQAACKTDGDATQLLELLPVWSKRIVGGSCRQYVDENGETQTYAHETTYRFDHVTVYTYSKEDGPEMLALVRGA